MNENFESNEENLHDEQETVILPKNPAPVKPSVVVLRSVKSGMFGIPETIALSLGLLSLLGVILFYTFFVMPAQSELQRQNTKLDNLKTDVIKESKNLGDFTTTEGKVAELVQSVDFFEQRNLPIGNFGRTDIYSRVNQLIRAYDLENTSGPDYSALEPTTQRKSSDEKAGKDRMQSLFPGMYVSMTVEGSYQNLRKFIRDIENSSQFVLINSVALESSETVEKRKAQEQEKAQVQSAPKVTNGQPLDSEINPPPNFKNANPTLQGIPAGRQPLNPNAQLPNSTSVQPKTIERKPAPKGRLRGEIVSLHLEMATYFRRDTPKSLEAK